LSAIELPILAGVYENEAQARCALDKLQIAGFNDDQLGMVMRSGGLLSICIIDALLSLGVPEEEAAIYQHELDVGHILVLVRHSGRIVEAFKCMFEITITGLSAVPQNQSQGQPGAAHNSSTNIPGEQASSHQEEASTSDDALCVWKLLKNAGLEHLL